MESDYLDFLLVIFWTFIAVVSTKFSDLLSMEHSLLITLQFYLLFLYVIASVFFRSMRKALITALPAIYTVLVLSFVHLMMFPEYDAIAPMSYFVTLLFGFLITLFFGYIHYTKKKPLYRIYRQYKLIIALVFLLLVVLFSGLATQALMFQFGVLSIIGISLAYLIFLFFFPPLLRIEKAITLAEQLTDDERKLKRYAENYGKDKQVYPFYAAWLGVAVRDIEQFIDRLEAKGYMGHNFFSMHNGVFWFLAIFSFVLGITSSSLDPSLVLYLPAIFFYLIGIASLGPQMVGNRSFRRMLGLVFLLAGLSIFRMISLTVFKFAAVGALIALVAIYFAYKDDEFISILFVAFFVGLLYLVGWSIYKPYILASRTVPFFITFVVFAMLALELVFKTY
ncbi:MAG: hypothetical protein GOU99_01005 [Candidatus Altiarchaeota archaeon]|nr:hypothetical protein [Candidatus Altiarchaeota archaeon]